MKSHFLLPLAAVLFSACGTPEKEGEAVETPKPAFTGTRVWSVGGMTIGGRTSTMNPISEAPMGPDESLAGPGPLEAALAASPGEPLPEGAAPTLDANIMPDGNPGETPAPQPQSPFDPSLENPPGGTVTPAPEGAIEVPAPPPPPPAPETPAPAAPAPGN